MAAPTPEQISSEPALLQALKTAATRARAVGEILPGLLLLGEDFTPFPARPGARGTRSWSEGCRWLSRRAAQVRGTTGQW